MSVGAVLDANSTGNWLDKCFTFFHSPSQAAVVCMGFTTSSLFALLDLLVLENDFDARQTSSNAANDFAKPG